MIEKLKKHTPEEVMAELEETGDVFASLLSTAIIEPVMPSDKEVMDKINEIIDVVNKLGGK